LFVTVLYNPHILNHSAILFVTVLYNIYFNTTTAWTLYYAFKGMWTAIDANGTYPGHGTCAEKGWTETQLSCCKVFY
jgi:hypothetical protein